MRKTYCFCFLISVILLTATSCRPKGILSSKQMEDLLVDLHTTEALLQVKGYTYGHDEQVRGYYLAVLEAHHTTQAQFDSSLVWYTANPTIFDKIYPNVIERLQANLDAMQARVDASISAHQQKVNEWLYQCQYGIEWQYWQKKYEKNDTKFVYVKKLL